jgi:Ca2+:H+ antiporter
MVLLGWALDKPLALLFDPFESIVLYISGLFKFSKSLHAFELNDVLLVHTMSYVVADGKSNWLEGLILIGKMSTLKYLTLKSSHSLSTGLYVVAAVTFWFYPGSNFSSTLAVCSTSIL